MSTLARSVDLERAAPIRDGAMNSYVVDAGEKSGSAGEEQQRRGLRRHDFDFVDRRRGERTAPRIASEL